MLQAIVMVTHLFSDQPMEVFSFLNLSMGSKPLISEGLNLLCLPLNPIGFLHYVRKRRKVDSMVYTGQLTLVKTGIILGVPQRIYWVLIQMEMMKEDRVGMI